jgi:hypothetical protein
MGFLSPAPWVSFITPGEMALKGRKGFTFAKISPFWQVIFENNPPPLSLPTKKKANPFGLAFL